MERKGGETVLRDDKAQTGESRRSWRWAGGRLYFSRQLENNVFFALTLAMLLAGIGYSVLGG